MNSDEELSLYGCQHVTPVFHQQRMATNEIGKLRISMVDEMRFARGFCRTGFSLSCFDFSCVARRQQKKG